MGQHRWGSHLVGSSLELFIFRLRLFNLQAAEQEPVVLSPHHVERNLTHPSLALRRAVLVWQHPGLRNGVIGLHPVSLCQESVPIMAGTAGEGKRQPT